MNMDAKAHDARPVPVGGARVPAGMEAHADWRALPEQPTQPEQDYGPEFARIKERRTRVQEAKKAIVDVERKASMLLGMEKTQLQPEAKSTGDVAERKAALDTAIAKALALKATGALKPEDAAGLEAVCKAATQDYADKHAYQSFKEQVTRVSRSIFRHAGELMQELKAAKKAFLASQRS